MNRSSAPGSGLAPAAFREAFVRFQGLIAANDKGRAFTNFHEGVAAVWEGYKPRLREYALRILAPDKWSEGDIGSGIILRRVIDAIAGLFSSMARIGRRREDGRG
jgi:hypothetical protein